LYVVHAANADALADARAALHALRGFDPDLAASVLEAPPKV